MIPSWIRPWALDRSELIFLILSLLSSHCVSAFQAQEREREEETGKVGRKADRRREKKKEKCSDVPPDLQHLLLSEGLPNHAVIKDSPIVILLLLEYVVGCAL